MSEHGFDVDQLRGITIFKNRNKYLVKWTNFSVNESTWESEDDVGPELVRTLESTVLKDSILLKNEILKELEEIDGLSINSSVPSILADSSSASDESFHEKGFNQDNGRNNKRAANLLQDESDSEYLQSGQIPIPDCDPLANNHSDTLMNDKYNDAIVIPKEIEQLNSEILVPTTKISQSFTPKFVKVDLHGSESDTDSDVSMAKAKSDGPISIQSIFDKSDVLGINKDLEINSIFRKVKIDLDDDLTMSDASPAKSTLDEPVVGHFGTSFSDLPVDVSPIQRKKKLQLPFPEVASPETKKYMEPESLSSTLIKSPVKKRPDADRKKSGILDVVSNKPVPNIKNPKSGPLLRVEDLLIQAKLQSKSSTKPPIAFSSFNGQMKDDLVSSKPALFKRDPKQPKKQTKSVPIQELPAQPASVVPPNLKVHSQPKTVQFSNKQVPTKDIKSTKPSIFIDHEPRGSNLERVPLKSNNLPKPRKFPNSTPINKSTVDIKAPAPNIFSSSDEDINIPTTAQIQVEPTRKLSSQFKQDVLKHIKSASNDNLVDPAKNATFDNARVPKPNRRALSSTQLEDLMDLGFAQMSANALSNGRPSVSRTSRPTSVPISRPVNHHVQSRNNSPYRAIPPAIKPVNTLPPNVNTNRSRSRTATTTQRNQVEVRASELKRPFKVPPRQPQKIRYKMRTAKPIYHKGRKILSLPMNPKDVFYAVNKLSPSLPNDILIQNDKSSKSSKSKDN